MEIKNDRDPAPHPLARRVCKCGCGVDFQPVNDKHVYLNSRHANRGYNKGPRKEKAKEEVEIQKILRKSNSLLRKHFNGGQEKDEEEKKEVFQYMRIMEADGFNQCFYIGKDVIDGKEYFFLHNFMYRICQDQDGYKLIAIRER